MLTKSLREDQVIEVFGDFNPYLTQEGIPSAKWESKILTYIDIPGLPLAWNKEIVVNRIRCHKLIAPFLAAAIHDLHCIPLVWNTINDFGGVYQFRAQRRTRGMLSRHSWGIAIDLDVGDNPFGHTPKVHPITIEIFQSHGFLWGGTFTGTRRDGMHFEFVDIKRL